jgi:hypothetical protein
MLRLIESMNPEWDDLFDEFWGPSWTGPRISRDKVWAGPA